LLFIPKTIAALGWQPSLSQCIKPESMRDSR